MIIAQNNILKTTEKFIGESLEEKIRRQTETNSPIEAISPMVYTERKEGVRADMNIRTDRFDVALEAMTDIAKGRRNKRAERLAGEEAKGQEIIKGAETPNA